MLQLFFFALDLFELVEVVLPADCALVIRFKIFVLPFFKLFILSVKLPLETIKIGFRVVETVLPFHHLILLFPQDVDPHEQVLMIIEKLYVLLL